MNIINKIIMTTAGISAAIAAKAQDDTYTIQMADALRESGKIYVVVAVLVLIFLGIIAYLFTIDRKIRRLENLSNKKE